MSADRSKGDTGSSAERSSSRTMVVVAGSGTVVLLAALLGLHLLESARDRNQAQIQELERQLAEARARGAIDLEAERAEDARAVEAFVRNTKPQVIDVDNALGIFVISLGTLHGMEVGERVRVYRDGTYVTDVLIDNVQATAAGGTIPEDAPRREIRKGDRIVRPPESGR